MGVCQKSGAEGSGDPKGGGIKSHMAAYYLITQFKLFIKLNVCGYISPFDLGDT